MANRKLARARAALRTGKLGHNRLARAVALGILLGGASMLPVAVHAANADWTGAASDEWTDDANWVVPPVNGSFVLIDALDPNATHLRTPAAAGVLVVGDQGQGQLVIEAGGQLEVAGVEYFEQIGNSAGLLLGNGANSVGTVNVDGTGATLAVAENVQVGHDGTGLLYIGNGGLAELAMHGVYAEVVVGPGYLSPGQGVGHVVVDGPGSTLRHAGGMNVINGSLDVGNGGLLESVERLEDAELAPRWVDVVGSASTAEASASANAIATVSGTGSAWNSRNYLQIGYGGNGALQVLDGGSATFTGFTYVGNRSREAGPDGRATGNYLQGNGAVLVSGAGSSFHLLANDEMSGDLLVAVYGQGWMSVDQQATADIAGIAVVGDHGQGALDISSGGAMEVGGSNADFIGLTIGNAAGSDGWVSVSGAGSSLTVDAGAQIGDSSHGYLGVTDGGVANIGLETAFAETVLGFSFYGWGADAASGHGSVEVSGAGSTLNYAGGFNVLNGDVSVREGGQLNGVDRASDNGFWIDLVGWGVPADPNTGFAGLYGNGYVEVDGEGSAWTSVNGLSVGSGGDGHLAIRNGGDASFAGLVELGGVSYVYDSPTGSPVEGVPPQAGFGMLSVSGAGSTFTLGTAPLAPAWGLGLMEVGVSGAGYVQVDDGGLLTTAGGIQLGQQGRLVIGGWAEDESALAAGTVATPTIQVDAGGSLEFHHDSSTVLDAAISGEGWIGATGGQTELAGDGSAFTGNVSVDHDAVLEVTGTLSAGFLDVGYDSIGTLLVDDGGGFHAGSAVLGNAMGGNGNVEVSGAGSSFTVDGWASIGRDGQGSLGVFDGATANLAMTEWYSETTLGFGDYGWTEHPEQGQGSIVVDGAGSTLNYAGGLNVLNGSLQVANGGQVLGHERADAAWVDLIGWGVPADPDPEHGFGGLPGIAFAGISGEGSAWHSANLLSVGEGGQGLLEVTEGADASFSGYVRLGTVSYLFDGQGGSPRLDVAPATGQGNILVTGAGSTFDVNALDGTASWQHGDLFVGYSFGASGGVTIADGASSDIDGLLVAGRRGDGAVNILDGGGMSVHGIDANLMGMVIGESAGSGGEVVVGGPDATLVVDGGAQIGSAGTGSLLVLDGGAAEIGLGTAFSETVVGFTFYGQGADAAGGEGNILVDGAGSMLTYGGGLNVLNGAMTVSHGGTVESQLREADGSATWLDVIGFGVPADPVPEHAFAGLYGNGMVTVTGNGSTWTSHNGLSIANGGEGMLAVLDGGRASFAGEACVGTLW
jgi:T5SS/PEP-CTERM-associated repeat protein